MKGSAQMNTQQTAGIIVSLLISIGAFILSYFQFKEKGFLLNNAYIWASREERKKMNHNKESKRPHYRQSGFVFMFLGISFLLFAAYMVVSWTWLLAIFWVSVILTVIYAVVSSVRMEQHK